MKKISVIAMIMCLLISMTSLCVSAKTQITTESVITPTDITLTVHLGVGFAGKKITSVMYNPAKSLEDLKNTDGAYNVTDVTRSVNSTLQGTADDKGDVIFKFVPGKIKGKYGIRISGTKVYTPFDTFVEFTTDQEAEAIIASLKGDTVTVDTIKALFDKKESLEIFGDYQIMKVDKNPIFTAFDNRSICSDKTRQKIFERLFQNRMTITTIADFSKAFCDATFIETLNDAENTAILSSFIDDYDSVINLSKENYFIKLYRDKGLCNEKVKAKVLESLFVPDFSNKTPKETIDLFCETMIVSMLSSVESYGQIDTIVDITKELLSKNGAKISDYSSQSSRLDICRDLKNIQPFSSISDFVNKFNNAILPKGNEDTSSPIGGSGSVSGSSKPTNIHISNDVVTPPVEVEVKPVFSDLDNVLWAKNSIESLASKGILQGNGDGHFYPETQITRSEFVKILILALDMKITGTANFDDVKESDWFYPYVSTAVNCGLMTGYNGHFGANELITRQDISTTIYRAFIARGIKFDIDTTKQTFNDDSQINDYAKEAVSALYSKKIISGVGNNNFAPKDFATRAQTAKIIYETLKILNS